MFISVVTHLSKVCTYQRLLHANEDGERYQKLLVGLSHLLKTSRDEFQSGNFLGGDWTTSTLTISWEWIHEQCNNCHSSDNTCQVDRWDGEDFRVWWTFEIRIVSCLNDTEVCTAQIECSLREVCCTSTAASMSARREHQWGDQVAPKLSRLPGCLNWIHVEMLMRQLAIEESSTHPERRIQRIVRL